MLRIVAAILVLVLAVLHLDHWNWEPHTEPVLGWIPADIAYHTLWLVGASIALVLVMRCAWKKAP